MQVRGPSEQWRFDVIALRPPCYDLFNESFHRNMAYMNVKKDGKSMLLSWTLDSVISRKL